MIDPKSERVVYSGGGHYMTEDDAGTLRTYAGAPPADLPGKLDELADHGGASVAGQFGVVGNSNYPESAVV